MHRLLLVFVVACSSSSGGSGTGSAGGSRWYDAELPVGVWVGMDIATNYQPNAFQQYFKIQGFAVWSDGHLTLGLPDTGFADFDRAAWERAVPTDPSLGGSPGSYQRDGDHWTITYAGGRQAAMKRVDDHLETEKAKLYRAKNVTGATLEGTYSWNTNTEDALLARPGCQPLVTFTRDGHFDDRGGFATPCRTSGPDAPGTGTYEIRDFSLVLHYGDGRTARHLITSIMNGDLRADNSRALIVNQVWQRRTAPIAPPNPTPTPPPPPPPTAASGDTIFDAVAFATPPGQAQRSGSSITFTDASGDQLQCMTVVFAGVASTGDPKRDFAADWKDVMLNGRTADASPAPDLGQTPNGLVFTAGGSMTTETSNSTRVYRALFVFEVAGRRIDTMVIAPSEAGLARCHVEELIKSMKAA